MKFTISFGTQVVGWAVPTERAGITDGWWARPTLQESPKVTHVARYVNYQHLSLSRSET